MSKVFEKLIFKQIEEYIEPFLSKHLTGFRKNHNTQNSLLYMLEKWKESLDQKKVIGAIYMDLSKAFDTLHHDLLISKLDAYGFSYSALTYIKSYLSNRSQRVNVNNNFSSWQNIKTGVPQGSILGPLLFNIYLNDIFTFLSSSFLANYADDTTLYSIHTNYKIMETTLRENFSQIKIWFYENFMQINPSKCHYMCLGQSKEKHDFILDDITKLELTHEHEMLGVIIDSNLKFDSHINTLCKKVGKKLNALTRVSQFLQPIQKQLLYNSFIKSQFSYCPLIWMFCSNYSNNLINKLHERALRMISGNYTSTFQELLNDNNETTIHVRNTHLLLIEIFKFVNELSPEIMNEIFKLKENTYHLRNPRELFATKKSTIKFGIDTISYKATQLWQNLPHFMKNVPSLAIFKNSITHLEINSSQCRLCKTYIKNLGYID